MPEEPRPTEPDTSESRAIVEEENALQQVASEPARLMGGDLTATSEPWGGSEFFLWPATSAQVSPSDWHDLPSRRMLGAVGPAMLEAGEEIMTTFVERLRHDPGLSAAADLPVALGMVIRSLASAERTSCRVLRHTGR